jgi:excisionase family DNA binding protein
VDDFKFLEDEATVGLMQLYSVEQVAEAAGLAPRTIYRAIAAGELEAVRLRRCVRISHEAAERWMTGGIDSGPALSAARRAAVKTRRPVGRLRPMLLSTGGRP